MTKLFIIGIMWGAFALVAMPPAFAGGTPTPQGATVYQFICAACHMPDGDGIEGVFPSLRDSAFIAGPEEQVIEVVLHGRGGMPSFAGELAAAELTAVISLIRLDWNNAAPVEQQLVEQLQNQAGTSEVLSRQQ